MICFQNKNNSQNSFGWRILYNNLFVLWYSAIIYSVQLRILYHFYLSIKAFVCACACVRWTSRLFLLNPKGSNISVSAVFHNCQHFYCDCCIVAKRTADIAVLQLSGIPTSISTEVGKIPYWNDSQASYKFDIMNSIIRAPFALAW